MKKLLIIGLLMGAATWISAEGRQIGLGVDGTINNSFQHAEGDSIIDTSSLRLFLLIPGSETSEWMIFGNFTGSKFEDKYGERLPAGIDYTQNSTGGGLGYHQVVASSGPFALLLGVEAGIDGYEAPSYYTGEYSNVATYVYVPVIFDIAVDKLVLRVSERVLELYAQSLTAPPNGVLAFGASLNQFAPQFGVYLSF